MSERFATTGQIEPSNDLPIFISPKAIFESQSQEKTHLNGKVMRRRLRYAAQQLPAEQMLEQLVYTGNFQGPPKMRILKESVASATGFSTSQQQVSKQIQLSYVQKQSKTLGNDSNNELEAQNFGYQTSAHTQKQQKHAKQKYVQQSSEDELMQPDSIGASQKDDDLVVTQGQFMKARLNQNQVSPRGRANHQDVESLPNIQIDVRKRYLPEDLKRHSAAQGHVTKAHGKTGNLVVTQSEESPNTKMTRSVTANNRREITAKRTDVMGLAQNIYSANQHPTLSEAERSQWHRRKRYQRGIEKHQTHVSFFDQTSNELKGLNMDKIVKHPEQISRLLQSIVSESRETRSSQSPASHKANQIHTEKKSYKTVSNNGGVKTRLTAMEDQSVKDQKTPRQLKPIWQSSETETEKMKKFTQTKQVLKNKLGPKMLVENDLRDTCGVSSVDLLMKIKSKLDDTGTLIKTDKQMSPTVTGAHTSPRNSIGRAEALQVLKHLTGHKQVDEDAVLLINANEILAKDGIHGKIAEVGIGFGTGRHTENRHKEHYQQLQVDSETTVMHVLTSPQTETKSRSNSGYNRKNFSKKPSRQNVQKPNASKKTSERHAAVKQAVHQKKTPERPVPSRCSYHGQGSRSNSPEKSEKNQKSPTPQPKKKRKSSSKHAPDDEGRIPEQAQVEIKKKLVHTKVQTDEQKPDQGKIDWNTYESVPLKLPKIPQPYIEILSQSILDKPMAKYPPLPPIPPRNVDWFNSKLYKQLYGKLKLPANQGILTQVEVDYLLELNRKRYFENYKAEQTEIDAVFLHAKQTIDYLIDNMIEPANYNQYFLLASPNVTQADVDRLLLRTQQLYEARQLAVTIFKAIDEVQLYSDEKPIHRLLLVSDDNATTEAKNKELYKQLLKCVLDRLTWSATQTELFHSNKFYNEKLIFKGENLKHSLTTWTDITSGCIAVQAGEDTEQAQIFKTWQKEQDPKLRTAMVPTEALNKLLKTKRNRVQQIVETIPPEQVDTQLKVIRKHRVITPIKEFVVSDSNYDLIEQSIDHEPVAPPIRDPLSGRQKKNQQQKHQQDSVQDFDQEQVSVFNPMAEFELKEPSIDRFKIKEHEKIQARNAVDKLYTIMPDALDALNSVRTEFTSIIDANEKIVDGKQVVVVNA